MTLASIKEDAKLQTFFKELVSSFLFTRGDLGRLDILNSPVEQSRDGKELIMTMREMLGVPVYSSEVRERKSVLLLLLLLLLLGYVG